jgi:putative transposase
VGDSLSFHIEGKLFALSEEHSQVTLKPMPSHLKRFHESGQTHFVTFGCYHRRKSLATPDAASIFEAALERVRRDFKLHVYGYVVMPEHVHLLVSEPEQTTLADAIKSLKQGVSRRLISLASRFRSSDFGTPRIWRTALSNLSNSAPRESAGLVAVS